MTAEAKHTPGMVEVSKEEFFKPIKERMLDVHPRIVTGYPHTSVWEFHREFGKPVYGKSVGHLDGSASYFVASKAEGRANG